LLKEQVQTLIQIGDAKYLDFIIKANSSLKSKAALRDMVEAPDHGTDGKFNPMQSVCKNGHVQMAQYLRDRAGYDFLQFKGNDGQNCLHFAVAKNRYKMAAYLMEESERTKSNKNKDGFKS